MADLPFPADALYLRVSEVATLLGFDVKTIRRWIKAGQLPATRMGGEWRIERADLKSYLLERGAGGIAHAI